MKLQAGQVFRLLCRVCTPQKIKYFVVASTAVPLRFFLINSSATPFQQARLHLMTSVLALDPQVQKFLGHASVLDCTELLGGFTAQELEDLRTADGTVFIGRLDATARRAVRAIVQSSRLLSADEKAYLLKEW